MPGTHHEVKIVIDDEELTDPQVPRDPAAVTDYLDLSRFRNPPRVFTRRRSADRVPRGRSTHTVPAHRARKLECMQSARDGRAVSKRSPGERLGTDVRIGFFYR